jgi:hypothetical protein
MAENDDYHKYRDGKQHLSVFTHASGEQLSYPARWWHHAPESLQAPHLGGALSCDNDDADPRVPEQQVSASAYVSDESDASKGQE